MPRQRRTAGFTLIELMVTVAILAVLAALAIPQYQLYVSRSQVNAALAEISPGRTAYETLVNQGVVDGDTFANANNLGLLSDTPRCTITASAPVNGQGMISCTIKGNAAVQGKHISFNRSSSGAWNCNSDVDTSYLPLNCTAS